MNEGSEEPFEQGDIIKVISLDDVQETNSASNGAERSSSDLKSESDGGEDDVDEEEGFESLDEADTVIDAHSKDVFCVDCAGGRWLASGGEDDCAMLFDLKKGFEAVLKITNHSDSVTYVRFNASETLLASGDMSGKISITDLSALSTRCQVEDCNDLEWLEWHNAADILIAGAGDGLIWMWLIGPTGVSQTKVFAGNAGITCSVGKLFPDGKRLLAGYIDGSARIWSLKDSTSVTVTLPRPSPCICLDVHSELPVAAIGTQDGRCILISTESAKMLRTFESEGWRSDENGGNEMETDDNFENSVECVRFCITKEPWLAVGRNNGELTVYDFNNGAARHQCNSNGQAVVGCRWYEKEAEIYILSAYHDGVLRVWDARNGDLVDAMSGGGADVFDMSLSLKDGRVFTACTGGKLRMFNLPSS